jgi:hypothetical protein
MRYLCFIALLGWVGCQFKNVPPPPLPPALKARRVAVQGLVPAQSLSFSTAPSGARGWTEVLEIGGQLTRVVHVEWPPFLSTHFVLQSSTNLIDWRTLGSTVQSSADPLTNTLIILDGTANLTPLMFYRIQAETNRAVP